MYLNNNIIVKSIEKICYFEFKVVVIVPTVIIMSVDIDDLFNNMDLQPFRNLRTAYQQTQFIKTRLPYVVSIGFLLEALLK